MNMVIYTIRFYKLLLLPSEQLLYPSGDPAALNMAAVSFSDKICQPMITEWFLKTENLSPTS
jgi:hypothetical protein